MTCCRRLRDRQKAALSDSQQQLLLDRLGAKPKSISAGPLSTAMELVEERRATRKKHLEKRAWFLTAEGQETVKAYGVDDSQEARHAQSSYLWLNMKVNTSAETLRH